MPQVPFQSVSNNFSQGFKTEFTALNFPENACTDASNCMFNRIGNVTRRLGVDLEANCTFNNFNGGSALNTYKWNNVAGDSELQIVVVQTGRLLSFYVSSHATVALPLSSTKLLTQIDIETFLAVDNSAADASVTECTFADGNGYLFVFHPNCDPFYCVYAAGTVTATSIAIQVRDFEGIPESIGDQTRPSTLTDDHHYNLANQGWSQSNTWTATSTTSVVSLSVGVSITFTVASGIPGITPGQLCSIQEPGHGGPYFSVASGSVTSYSGTTLVVLVTSVIPGWAGSSGSHWVIQSLNTDLLGTWFTTTGNYPSNSDVWWLYKNTSGVFAPSTTIANVTLSGTAPKGHFILNAFNQSRSSVSGITTSATLTSNGLRPVVGTWFQGRVWYAGVNAQNYHETIYFSQIVQSIKQFSKCYQDNDPTSETFFDLLPTDGGVIKIQGCGTVYKLFPIQNGLLVFAANGVWFITGSQGIGFAANDYTVAKISSIQSVSPTSYVNVQGFPVWWNEEGIYEISLNQQYSPYGPSRGAMNSGGLMVQPLTYATIQTFYQNIPFASKKFVRGEYDPLNWEIRWCYRSTAETSGNRYHFDSVLHFNTITQAFSPWSFTADPMFPSISGIIYVQSPGGTNAPDPTIKYLVTYSNVISFGEERDTNYVDWNTVKTQNFTSHFVSAYRLHGKAQFRSQINYLYLFLNSLVNSSYKIQGIWDFTNSPDSGRWTNKEQVDFLPSTYDVRFKRHRINGRGLAYQIKIQSVDGKPFDIIGWSVDERINTAV